MQKKPRDDADSIFVGFYAIFGLLQSTRPLWAIENLFSGEDDEGMHLVGNNIAPVTQGYLMPGLWWYIPIAS